MNYFDIAYTAIGGLGVFFLGLKFLSEGLQSGSTEAIQRILATFTKNRILAVLAGVGITVVVQSSSISTVMTVSLAGNRGNSRGQYRYHSDRLDTLDQGGQVRFAPDRPWHLPNDGGQVRPR